MNLCNRCLCAKCGNKNCTQGCDIFCTSEYDTRTLDCDNFISGEYEDYEDDDIETAERRIRGVF